MSVHDLFASKDCVTVGCPTEADGPDGLCRHCRARFGRPKPRPRLELVHSREETPMPSCKNHPGRAAKSSRGKYAYLCDGCIAERKVAAQPTPPLAAVPDPDVVEAIASTPDLDVLVPESLPVPPLDQPYPALESDEAGPLLVELLDAQPAYELAEEAAATVKDRMQKYGPPVENHGCTAEMWGSWLNRRFGVRLELTAADVCWLNVLQKLSREANLPAGDNRLDVMGFAINAELSIRT